MVVYTCFRRNASQQTNSTPSGSKGIICCFLVLSAKGRCSGAYTYLLILTKHQQRRGQPSQRGRHGPARHVQQRWLGWRCQHLYSPCMPPCRDSSCHTKQERHNSNLEAQLAAQQHRREAAHHTWLLPRSASYPPLWCRSTSGCCHCECRAQTRSSQTPLCCCEQQTSLLRTVKAALGGGGCRHTCSSLTQQQCSAAVAVWHSTPTHWKQYKPQPSPALTRSACQAPSMPSTPHPKHLHHV